MRYYLIYSKSFRSQVQQLIKVSPILKTQILATLELLLYDPFSDFLSTQRNGDIFTTKITKGVKLFWEQSSTQKRYIHLLTLSGYERTNKEIYTR
ncbi:MAG: hypothetical protein US52_C0009G0014 [candidate division WS6 bacterium GW2011_GWA2_37_6]|uniref:Type II toxin-antitoxin system RelE/ParE family toxin n=1 Tax=candidate division WS6 bacterium GW2011_GWA2_37_6 TaxID=1619087 RepID=A0A0G0H1R4_9BACT|nr:MAG: hypothetical protein US52_C0009G0014 [candidate division WS6 bacterium GW2011_GWA2_37_6]